MKATWLGIILTFGLIAFVLSGCATGVALSPSPLPIGDGSIPIGRVKGRAVDNISVSVQIGLNIYTMFPNEEGIVNMPSTTPGGQWRVRAEADNAQTILFDVQVAAKQSDIFELRLMPVDRKKDFSSIRLDHKTPVVLKVGQTLKIKTIIEGTNTSGLVPSYWINGANGKITPGGVFNATAAGTGILVTELYGCRDAMLIKVLP